MTLPGRKGNFLSLQEFEPLISSVGSTRSANCSTTKALHIYKFKIEEESGQSHVCHLTKRLGAANLFGRWWKTPIPYSKSSWFKFSFLSKFFWCNPGFPRLWLEKATAIVVFTSILMIVLISFCNQTALLIMQFCKFCNSHSDGLARYFSFIYNHSLLLCCGKDLNPCQYSCT